MQLLAYEYNYFGRGLVAIAMEVPPVYLLEKSGADPGLTVGGEGGAKYTAHVSAHEILCVTPTFDVISAHDMLYEEKVNK